MQMGAIRKHYGFEEAVVKAIEAGVDILAIANNSVFEEDVATRTVDIIRRAVETGRLNAERIDRSYRRIQTLKAFDGGPLIRHPVRLRRRDCSLPLAAKRGGEYLGVGSLGVCASLV